MPFSFLCLRHLLLIASLSIALSSVGHGALLVSGPEQDLIWAGGASPTMSLQIENPLEELEDILSYQLLLEIVPAGGTGELLFASATVPSGYVLPPPSFMTVMGTGSSSISVGDFSFVGSILQADESFNLLNLEFEPSNSNQPLGRFEVKMSLAPEDGASLYIDGQLSSQLFANSVPEALVLGAILIKPLGAAVPEPECLMLLLLGTYAMYVRYGRKMWSAG